MPTLVAMPGKHGLAPGQWICARLTLGWKSHNPLKSLRCNLQETPAWLQAASFCKRLRQKSRTYPGFDIQSPWLDFRQRLR